MTGEDENARGDRERRLERKAAAAFDASVRNLDADTRSRLNRRRQAALAELDRVGLRPWLQWAPAGGIAAAAVRVDQHGIRCIERGIIVDTRTVHGL